MFIWIYFLKLYKCYIFILWQYDVTKKLPLLLLLLSLSFSYMLSPYQSLALFHFALVFFLTPFIFLGISSQYMMSPSFRMHKPENSEPSLKILFTHCVCVCVCVCMFYSVGIFKTQVIFSISSKP